MTNKENAKTQQSNKISQEDYAQTMNFIGQNLLTSLIQTMQNVPEPLRSNDMVMQGLAAFLSNVIHKQFPKDGKARQQILERFSALVGTHIGEMENA